MPLWKHIKKIFLILCLQRIYNPIEIRLESMKILKNNLVLNSLLLIKATIRHERLELEMRTRIICELEDRVHLDLS